VKNFKIKKISEVRREDLIKFYSKVFKKRDDRLINNFEWCYRIGYNDLEPIVIELENNIIGHAGLIPIDLEISKKKKTAIWFTDFVILKEFRNKGYGKILTKEWMKICPLQITFCNNDSLKIFKKFGWKESYDFERILTPINYFKFFPAIKKLFVKKLSIESNLKEISSFEKEISNIVTLENKKNINNNEAYVIRDESWFEWRLIKCPYKEDVYLFQYENDFIIAHSLKKNNLKRLNLIYCSTNFNSKIFKMIKFWCSNNDIDYTWMIQSKKTIKEKFNILHLKKRINFAFFHNDSAENQIFNNNINLQGIDSDSDFNDL